MSLLLHALLLGPAIFEPDLYSGLTDAQSLGYLLADERIWVVRYIELAFQFCPLTMVIGDAFLPPFRISYNEMQFGSGHKPLRLQILD